MAASTANSDNEENLIFVPEQMSWIDYQIKMLQLCAKRNSQIYGWVFKGYTAYVDIMYLALIIQNWQYSIQMCNIYWNRSVLLCMVGADLVK